MRKMMMTCGMVGLVATAMAASLPVELTSIDYRVKVNGQSVDVLGVPAPTMRDAQLPASAELPYYAAFFEADGEVTITVESDEDLSKTRILPSSLGVKPITCTRGEVTFKAKPPFVAVVEPTGRDRALIISGKRLGGESRGRKEEKVGGESRSRLEDNDSSVQPSTSNLQPRFFPAGRYHFDKPIELKTGETMYLAPGAVVEAAVVARGDNIRICGSGILSGLPWEWTKGPFGYHLTVIGKNNTVEGITILGSFHWTLVLRNCENTTIDGVNILNGRVLNDDGIDVCESRNTTIRNCFIRSQDDCITPKYWCEGLKVENCILWTDVANIFRIGYECAGPQHAFCDFHVKDIDILHQSVRKTKPGEMWSENAVYIQASNGMRFGNMLFEDFRFDNPELGDNFACIRTQRTHDRWQQHKMAGDIDGVTFRNIRFPNGLPEGAEPIWIENHHPERKNTNIRFEKFERELPMTVRGKVGKIDKVK